MTIYVQHSTHSKSYYDQSCCAHLSAFFIAYADMHRLHNLDLWTLTLNWRTFADKNDDLQKLQEQKASKTHMKTEEPTKVRKKSRLSLSGNDDEIRGTFFE